MAWLKRASTSNSQRQLPTSQLPTPNSQLTTPEHAPLALSPARLACPSVAAGRGARPTASPALALRSVAAPSSRQTVVIAPQPASPHACDAVGRLSRVRACDTPRSRTCQPGRYRPVTAASTRHACLSSGRRLRQRHSLQSWKSADARFPRRVRSPRSGCGEIPQALCAA